MKLAQVTVINPPSSIFNTWLFADFFATLFSRILLFAISIAGLYFFVRLLMSGYSFMSSLGDESRIRNVQKEVTNSLFGLLIVVASYFLMQIIEKILGLSIL